MSEPSNSTDAATTAFGAAQRGNPKRHLGWSDGVWSGDNVSLALARALCNAGALVEVSYWAKRPADSNDPISAIGVIKNVLGPDTIWTGNVPSFQPANSE